MYPKNNTYNILLMVAILVIILIIMVIISKQKHNYPLPSNRSIQFEGSAKVIGATYYNKLFRFSISTPDSNWEFAYSPEMDSSWIQGKNSINIVKMSRISQNDTIAIVEVAVFKENAKISPKELAFRNLAQIKNQYKQSDEAVSVVGDVTVAGSSNMVGAFYVVELPQKSPYPYPVWVTMFFIRNQLAYCILCQTMRDKYEFLRPNLETILKSFKFL